MNPYLNAILDIQNAPNILVDGTNKFSGFKALDPGFNFMMGKNPVDGYYYFTVLGEGGSPVNRDNFIYKLDYETLTIIEEFQLDLGLTSSYDSHIKGVLNFDSSGNIIIAVEQGANSTGFSDGHNTDMLLYRTTTPGDLSTLSLVNQIAGFFAYPKIWNFGSDYYLNARGSSAELNLSKSTILKSTDSGVNFTEHLIINLQDPNFRAYTNAIHSFDTNEMIVALNVRNNDSSSFESLSILKSTDGINWSNWQGTFTKDVSVSGALTYAEIKSNMLVWEIVPDSEAVNFEGGIVKNGEIKILASRSTTTNIVVDGNTQQEYAELRLFSYSNGWQYEDLSEILIKDFLHVWGRERTLQYVADLNNDYIFILDRTDTSECKLYRYSSSDGFVTYEAELIYSDEGNYYYGSNAFNVITNNHLIALIDVEDINDLNSDADVRLIKPEN